MTLDKARELLTVQINFGGGNNRNGTQLIFAEVERGAAAAQAPIGTLDLERIVGIKLGTYFTK